MKKANHPLEADETTLKEVRAIYAELSQQQIDRNCVRMKTCCHFKLTGRTPFLTKGEAIVAARALRQTGRTRLPDAVGGSCPLLDQATGDCMIYESRPFGCRTHFCAAAGGPYARGEVIDLIRRLEELDARLKGDGPRRIEVALSAALSRRRESATPP
jgi:Fe-S-cluster containining protein